MRRIVLVGLVGGAALGVAIAVTRRRALTVEPATGTGVAEWPPLRLAPPLIDGTDGHEPAPWVAPIGGQCPASHPIKGNANSGIYHVPGGRFYDAIIPDRCYRDEAAAEADGMRASKR
jgi:hypothetical protein